MSRRHSLIPLVAVAALSAAPSPAQDQIPSIVVPSPAVRAVLSRSPPSGTIWGLRTDNRVLPPHMRIAADKGSGDDSTRSSLAAWMAGASLPANYLRGAGGTFVGGDAAFDLTVAAALGELPTPREYIIERTLSGLSTRGGGLAADAAQRWAVRSAADGLLRRLVPASLTTTTYTRELVAQSIGTTAGALSAAVFLEYGLFLAGMQGIDRANVGVAGAVAGALLGAGATLALYSGVGYFAASGLSGAAAHSATMAALGYGSVAVGGWGMAGGAVVLGGVGFGLVLGVPIVAKIGYDVWSRKDQNYYVRLTLDRLRGRTHHVTPEEAARMVPLD